MAITHVTYRNSNDLPFETTTAPGPVPQCLTGSRITSRTYCTCGHAGTVHKRQTLTTHPYSQSNPLGYRGDCTANIRRTNTRTGLIRWLECECTWFTEDLER